jgi:hypothetical protein
MDELFNVEGRPLLNALIGSSPDSVFFDTTKRLEIENKMEF